MDQQAGRGPFRDFASPGRLLIIGAAVATLALAAVIGVTLPHHDSAHPHPAQPRVDYTKDNDANVHLQLAAGQLIADNEADPTFGGSRIVPTGLEIAVVGRPSPALSRTIETLRAQVPVATRRVTHSWQHMQALTTRIDGDQPSWKRAGIELTMWGPDDGANRVKVWLAHFTPAAERALLERYGADEVVVDHESTTIAASTG